MADSKLTITVLGCGYVGVTTAVVLANCGVKVYAIEPMPARLDILKQGKSFFYEAGIDALIKRGMDGGMLTFTDSYEEAIPTSTIVFSCVGTPDNADGSSNLSYVFDSAEQASAHIKPGTIFVQKSTVPVGTGARIIELFKKHGADVKYVSNPEFLRESTAIADTLWFDRIVAGSDDQTAARAIIDLYKTIEQHADAVGVAAGVEKPASVPIPQYMLTSRNSAELIKVTANAFLALKISFANSIAKLADLAGADVNQVMDGVGSDRRIGRAFLNAGRGYGGGCFPKDVSGLIRSAEEYGAGMEIMKAATEVNESMPHYVINKAKAALGSKEDNAFSGKRVAVLGLAFKAGTSDVRKSPAVTIANTIAEQGAHVTAYDPEAMEEAREDLDKAITLVDSIDAAIHETDVIFVATDWPEFVSLDLAKLAKDSGAKMLVDCMNRYDSAKVADASLSYIGVGRR
jgi:UDPglucose 6-dehydrogenase